VQLEARGALHMKATLVSQAARSAYRQVEARLGARLSRQDLGVEQARRPPRPPPCRRLQATQCAWDAPVWPVPC